MSNSLNPDQTTQNVRPDLGPNGLQRLSADITSRHRGSYMIAHVLLNLLNELEKRDKCEACRAFYLFFEMKCNYLLKTLLFALG